jgi:hypothetical protein
MKPRIPTLVTNPADDLEFAVAAASALREAGTPDELEAALRPDYPDVLVRERVLTAEPLVWYVYRDGHWVRASDRAEEGADGPA